MKLIDRNVYERTYEVESQDGSVRERLLIQRDDTIELVRAVVKKMLPSRLDGWHTYRITHKKAFTNVYVDEEPISFISGTTTLANTTNDVRFGDGSDSDTHGFLLDWFIFDVTGAYAPGESEIPQGLFVDSPEPSSVEIAEQLVSEKHELAQSYPNPFNPETTIQFRLPKSGHVTITVYNVLGQ